MNASLRKVLIIAVSLSIACTTGYGQLNLSKYEAGITAGLFVYQGDLTPSRFGSYRTPGFNMNIFINRILNPAFSLRTNFSFGKLRGDDSKYSSPAWRRQRNFNFSSPVFEISELIVWNVLETNRGLTAFVYGGAGLSFLKIKRDWSNFNGEYFSSEPGVQTGLAANAQHQLPGIIPVVPVGAGLRHSLSQKLSIVAETSYRLTYTDYLDGFSRSANPSRNDHFQNHSIGIIYKFGKKSGIDCPVVGN